MILKRRNSTDRKGLQRKNSFERSRTRVAALLRLFIGLCGFTFLVAFGQPTKSLADDISLPADHGYVLIRITMNSRFEIDERDRLVFNDYDSGESFNVNLRTPYSGGVNSYLSLVSVTEGNYYCHQHAPNYTLPQPCFMERRKTELTANDLFEVKSGVINYVGDWDVTKLLRFSRRNESQELNVTYDMATIEKAKSLFPAQMGKYESFISYKGRKAISLTDLAELLRRHAEPADKLD